MIFAVLGSLGGLTAFGTAIWIVVRAIFRQVGATEDNTRALDELRSSVLKLDVQVDEHAQRLARLEGFRQRR